MRIWKIVECSQSLAVGREVVLDFQEEKNGRILSLDGEVLLNFGKAFDNGEGDSNCYLITLPDVTVLLESTGEEIDFCLVEEDFDEEDWEYTPIFEDEDV
jgi:hypothetical protein